MFHWRPEAAGAVASRFEGAFLSVARGARCSTSTSSGFFGLSLSRCLAGCKALFRSLSSCVSFRFVLLFSLFSVLRYKLSLYLLSQI